MIIFECHDITLFCFYSNINLCYGILYTSLIPVAKYLDTFVFRITFKFNTHLRFNKTLLLMSRGKYFVYNWKPQTYTKYISLVFGQSVITRIQHSPKYIFHSGILLMVSNRSVGNIYYEKIQYTMSR